MIKKLASHIREYKTSSILTSLFVSFEVVLEVLIPFVMSKMIDFGIEAGQINEIVKFGSILSAMALCSLFFGFASGSMCAKASSGFAKNLRKDMFFNVQDFSFSNIDKFSTAGIITRLTTDIGYVQNAFQMIIRMAIRAPLMLVLTLELTFAINTNMALIFLVCAPILALVVFLILSKAHPIFQKVIKEYDTLNNVVEENVQSQRVIKSFVREDFEIKKFKKVNNQIYKDFSRARKLVATASPIMQATIYACIILISWVGAKIIVESSGTLLTTGQLMSLFSYTMQILGSLMMLSFVLVVVTIARPSAERIVEILDEKTSISSPQNAITCVENGTIEFENVCFKYSSKSDQNVLNNINLQIESGQTVGILGATGSAKSTLVSLVPRLYDATEGVIKVGGIDVKKYDLHALRDSVSVVLQKNVLFSGTIKQNLLWGNENATDDEIANACKLAQADAFVEAMPNGYNSHIEQGGTNISGGQKQRLCIARAILKKPKILILDDSTSAVDTKTEAKIRSGLKSCLPNTTKIIIAQRIQSVVDADKIVVMENGSIVAVGTHKQLLQSNKLYSEIYASQTKKEERQNATTKF